MRAMKLSPFDVDAFIMTYSSKSTYHY
jgi:hypothetical protein